MTINTALDTSAAVMRTADQQPTAYLHEREISVQLVRDLYDRGRIAIPFLLILIFIVRWAIGPAYVESEVVRGAFYALVAITLVRWIIAMVPVQHRNAVAGVRTLLVFFACGAALSSIGLAAIIVLSWPLLDVAHIAILAVIISGLMSGALMSMGFSPLVYLLYLAPAVGALFAMAVTDPRPAWGADILATSFVLFTTAMMVFSYDQYRTRRRAIELSLQLSDMVVRDTLTNLYNRRFLHEFMSVEAARIARDVTDMERGRLPEYKAAGGVYIVDLDHFKQINDTYGHGTGDDILRQTAVALTHALRNSDVIVRWGGEEFVAVARAKEPHQLAIVAEKLRAAVETMEKKLSDGRVLHTSCSVGFCVIPFFPDKPRLLTWEQGLAIADAALYVAKSEGRNRWVGVSRGETPWADAEKTLEDVLRDLNGAAARGLVRLERSKTSS